MKIKIVHVKNMLMGWDIGVNVEADGDQQITDVQVKVNGLPEVREQPSSGTQSWDQQLTQKGIFPGDNQVEVLASDQNGNQTRAEQKWS